MIKIILKLVLHINNGMWTESIGAQTFKSEQHASSVNFEVRKNCGSKGALKLDATYDTIAIRLAYDTTVPLFHRGYRTLKATR
jgi:hypothetical protein